MGLQSCKKGVSMTTAIMAKRISPMLATDNTERTILFYQNVLGFTPTLQSSNYSICRA